MTERVTKRVLVFSGIVFGTGIIGIATGFLGGFIGAQLLRGDLAGFGDLAGAIAGMVIGYPLGVVISLVIINKLLHYRGSLLFGFLGSCAGLLLTIGLAEPLNLNADPNLLFGAFFLATPILATAGFHLRNR